MFDVFKTLDLSFLGGPWTDCYIKYYAFTVEHLNKLNTIKPTTEQSEAVKVISEILESVFAEGYAIKQGQRVALTKDDMKKLPWEIQNASIDLFKSDGVKKNSPSLENPSLIASEG